MLTLRRLILIVVVLILFIGGFLFFLNQDNGSTDGIIPVVTLKQGQTIKNVPAIYQSVRLANGKNSVFISYDGYEDLVGILLNEYNAIDFEDGSHVALSLSGAGIEEVGLYQIVIDDLGFESSTKVDLAKARNINTMTDVVIEPDQVYLLHYLDNENPEIYESVEVIYAFFVK